MPKPAKTRSPVPPAPWNTNLPEVVDPTWILKALGAVVILAIVCAYVSVCLLFWHSQWQLVLHPSRAVADTPAKVGLSFTEVHFGVDASGEPQLAGWWIPGDLPSDPTVLMLHSGDGSMSDALQQALGLHNARMNVLLFDYRGYGRSGGQHPSQALMQEDAATALMYLTSTRAIPAGSLVVWGTGAGGALAVKLCADNKQVTALILDRPDGDFTARVVADARSHIVPVSLLFHESFTLAEPLHTLATPKLLISHTTGSAPVELRRAADPKMTLELPAGSDAALHEALNRFLSSYLRQAPGTLAPLATR